MKLHNRFLFATLMIVGGRIHIVCMDTILSGENRLEIRAGDLWCGNLPRKYRITKESEIPEVAEDMICKSCLKRYNQFLVDRHLVEVAQ